MTYYQLYLDWPGENISLIHFARGLLNSSIEAYSVLCSFDSAKFTGHKLWIELQNTSENGLTLVWLGVVKSDDNDTANKSGSSWITYKEHKPIQWTNWDPVE